MSLSRGTRIEICPTRLGRDFVAYAAFDGSIGVVEALTGSGGDLKARVDVMSEAKDRTGRKFLPAKALKVIPGWPRNPGPPRSDSNVAPVQTTSKPR